MSRPAQGPSRPLGTGKTPSHLPQPGVSVPSGPRRSAGAVPGIARTASSLRQGPLTQPGGARTSLPAHLRNLSTPRIPSPLGKGTPGRQLKQSLPVRTSKTTERHVFLPEDPQLAPLPSSPMGSQVNLAAPPRSTPGPSRERDQRPHDERSDAEKMTKRERDENRLPRLTAYATAEGYRLKLLQAFLKREHGVGVVRVFDDCIYAVYSLPLLPGYGASTRIRSSPAVKSPGGVSLLERMTLAEDLGYYDSYFPINNEQDEPHRGENAAEYILSTSPASPIAQMTASEDGPPHIVQDEAREAELDRIEERLEAAEISGEPANLLGLQQSLDSADGTEAVVEDENLLSLGTHLSPEHPGMLEHIPAQATSPDQLRSPLPIAELDSNGDVPAPRIMARPKPRPRSKSANLTGKVAEAVFFSYGVSVFFGFQEDEEKEIMEDCEAAGTWVRPLEVEDWETEEMHFNYDWEAEHPRIYNDMFTFKSHNHLFKLSLAHAIAQSTKLSIYEAIMQETLSLTSDFPKELSTTGHLQLNRRQALKMTGRLFKLRMDVNLIGGVLDTPELFWSEASLFPLYDAVREYLELSARVQVLNDRLGVAGDLLEVIHDYIGEGATDRITWIIIWLIVVACLVELGEVIARLVVHGLSKSRKPGEILVLTGSKALFSGIRQISGL